jgi:hypothetical protein
MYFRTEVKICEKVKDKFGDKQYLEVKNIRRELIMKKTLLVSLAVSFLVFGAGCQLFDSDPASPSFPSAEKPAETEYDLDSPTGGFTYSDEPEAFGEPELYTTYKNNEIVTEDELENEEEVRCPRADRYRFRAIWGHLPRVSAISDTIECFPKDWSGRLHLNGGIIVIEKVIAFDPEDYLRRVDKSTIEWVSFTCPHVDGIQVRLIVPPAASNDSSEAVQPTLTIDTGPYTRTFTMEELEALDITTPVDRCNNYISINSHIINPKCPHGYLMGGWKAFPIDTTEVTPDSSDTNRGIRGIYRGVWMNKNGRVSGYLKGIYGINSQGERVFYGKYISLGGKFRGIIKGNYGAATDADIANNPRGWFRGHWLNKAGVLKGRLKGEWVSDRAGFGYFHGIWGMDCSNYL